MKMTGKSWKISLEELIMTLAVMLGAWLFGVILVGVIMCMADDADDYAIMGSFIAIISWVAVCVFVAAATFERRFSTAIGMGRTRKEFFICRTIVTVINTVLEVLALAVLYLLETGLAKILYPGMPCGFDIMPYVAKPGWILAAVILMPSAGMLLGMLITRFQRKAFWAIWVIWMVGSLGMGKISHMLTENPESLPTRLVDGCLRTFNNLGSSGQAGAMILLSLVLLGGAFIGLRRQEVRQM